ncbi:MAG: AMP-binding protein, partial [Acidimicrobiia bacterium]
MIHWFERVPADSVFLKTSERVWTYRQIRDAIASRAIQKVVTVRPRLDAEGVMSLLAGMAGGGALVAGPNDDPGPVENIEGAALVAYTSGSSGTPKGVRLTMGNLDAASRASAIHLGHDDGDTWLLAMPLNHVGGMSILVRSAYTGGAVRLESGFAPERFAEALHDDVTLASVVPTMLKRLLDHDAGPYRGLKAVLVGGGPIPEGLLERAVAAGLPVLPTYGMTETFGQVATLRPGSPIQRKADPLPGVEARVDDSGRIALKSDQISPGYLGEPDRDDEWFVTSDIGEIDDDGAIRVLRR